MQKRIIFIVFLIAIFVNGSYAFANPNFTDVGGHWAENTITWANSEGIIQGYPDKTFRPDKAVTEAEFLAMFFRTFTITPKVEKQEHWADGAYELAEKLNYPVQGMDDLSKRDLIIDRTQVAEIVSSSYGVHYREEDAIQYLLGNELAQGKTGEPTIEGYAGEDNLTRAEAVQFLKNLKEKGKDVLEERPKEPSPRSELPPLPVKDEETPENRKSNGEDNTAGDENDLNENQEALVKIADNPDKLDSYGDLLKFVQLLDHYEALADEVRPANNFDNYLLIGNEGKYGDNLSISYSDTYGSNLYVDISVFEENEEALLKDIFKVYYPNSYNEVFNLYLEHKQKPAPSDSTNHVFDNRKFRIGKGISGAVSCIIEVKADE